MVFAWAFAVQWAIGAVINLWPLSAAGYDARGYRVAFAAAFAIALLAWLWMLLQTRAISRAEA